MSAVTDDGAETSVIVGAEKYQPAAPLGALGTAVRLVTRGVRSRSGVWTSAGGLGSDVRPLLAAATIVTV